LAVADLVTLGFKVDAGEVKAASRELDNLKRSTGEAEKASSRLSSAMSAAKIGLAAAGSAAAAAGAAVALLAKRGLESVDSQVKLARSLSATTDAVRAVQLAAGEAGLDGMDESLNRLNRRLGAAQMGMATYSDSVKALGLNLQTLASMDADQRVAAIADAVRDSGLSAQETARHLQILGFQQAQANAFFRAGGDAIRDARAAVDEYGLSMSAVDSAMVEQANDAWGRNALILEGIQNRLAVAVAPAMLAVANAFQDGAKEASGFGDVVVESVDFATRAVAFMADAVDGLRRVFLVAGQGVATFAHSAVALMYSVDDAIINGPVRAVNSLLSVMSKLPGVDFEAIGLTKLGAQVKAQAEESKRAIEAGVDDIQDTLAKPMPSVAILDALEAARAEMESTAKEQASFDDAARKNVGSFEDIADAAGSAAVKEKELADQFEALRKQIDPAYAATKNYEDSIKTLDQALAKGLITAGEYSSLLYKLNESMKNTDESARDAAESASKLSDEFESLRRRVDPAYAATMDYAEAVDTLNQALMNGLISADEYQKLLEKVESSVNKTAKNISDAADPVAEAWKNGLKRIDDSFASVWKGAFESFKSFRKSLTDAFLSMLAELAHAAITRPIMLSIGAAGSIIPGAASAAAGGATGTGGTFSLISTAKTAYDAVTGGFKSIGTAVGDAANNIGTWVVNNTTGVLNQMGGSLMNASASIGTAASYLSGAAAGAALGSVISGTYEAFGNANIANIGGTIVGSIIGGPIGGAIGGALGGVINRAFGRGPKKVTDYGISGTLSTEGADIQQYQKWKQKGGAFSSSKSGTRHNPVNDELDQYLDAAVNSITMATQAYADVLGLNANAIDGITQNIKISLEDMNPEEQQAAIEKAIGGFGDLLAEQYAIPFIRADETAGAAMARLANSLLTVNQALAVLDQTLLASTVDAGDAASALLDIFGGADNFAKSTTAYYQAFYSEAERAAKSTSQLTDVLSSMGLTLPQTRDEYRAMIEAQDLMTDSGRQTYAALMNLAPAFDEVVRYNESVTAAAEEAARAQAAAAEEAARAQAAAAEEAARAQAAAAEEAAHTLGVVNQAFEQINGTLLDSADSAFSFVDAFGGLDELVSGVNAYYQAFYSSATRAAIEAGKLNDSLLTLGVSIPKTRDEFRSLVEAQDLTTESGRRTYAALINLAPAFDAAASASESYAEAERSAADARLNDARTLATVNQAFKQLGRTLLDSTDSANALVAAFGSLDSFVSSTTAYRQAFYSADEQSASAAAQLSGVFEQLGLSIPETRDQYRALVDAQDLATDAGRRAYAALVTLAPAFDAAATAAQSAADAVDMSAEASRTQHVADIARGAADSAQAASDAAKAASDSANAAYKVASDRAAEAESAVSAAMDALRRSVSAQIDVVRKEADARIKANQLALDAARAGLEALQGEIRQLESARKSLAGEFAPNQSAIRDAAVSRLAYAVASGDMSGVGDAAEVAARINEGAYTNSADYQLEQARILNMLAQAGDIAEDQATSAEQVVSGLESAIDAIRDASEAEIDRLNAIIDSAQAQVDALNGVAVGIIGIGDALSELSAAIADVPAARAQAQAAEQASAAAQARADAQARAAAAAQEAAQRAAQEAAAAQQAAASAQQAQTAASAQAAAEAAQQASAVAAELAAQQSAQQQSARAAEVTANYQALFGHSGDPEGMQYWMDSGLTGPELTNAMRTAGIGMGVTPLFANGGKHSGGLRIVGERGPEIEATGPSRIVSNDKLMNAIGSSDELVGEIRALRQENIAAQRAIERNTRDLTQLNKRWDRAGMPETRVLA
jgi:uncharacterized protein YoxC